MTNELFTRISNESMIHIIEHDNPGKPGYVWQCPWNCKESIDVFETQDSALIDAINYLSSSWEEARINYKKLSVILLDETQTRTNQYLWLTICFLVGAIGGLTKWIFDLLH